MNEIKTRRGRPMKDDSKRKVISTRATDEIYNMLDIICKKHECSRAHALEKMIRNQYNLTEMGIDLL